MIRLRLKRNCTSETGTFGVLIYKGDPFALTMELPWRKNQRNVSCIPIGEYQCRKTHSPTFGKTFEICHVPARSKILFHPGNFLSDSRGCPLVGESFKFFKGRDESPGLSQSRKGFNELMSIMEPYEEFQLLITEHYDQSWEHAE